jgi:hypothetical protein
MKGSQKEALNGKFHNTRPVGKPRTRWRTSSRGTLHILGIYDDGEDEQKTEKNGGVS